MGELVSLDGHDLTGLDREGSWKVNELIGWWERPAVKDPPHSRPHADGSIPVPIVYESRLITIRGRVSSKSHEYLHEAINTISSLGYRGNADLVVAGHGPLQHAVVDPRGEITTKLHTENFLSFSIPLEAHDPFKYGELRPVNVASGVTGSVWHDGTVEAWPVVTVTGNMPNGYTLTFRSQTVTVPMGIPSGVTHRIDYRTRRLYVNGAVFFGAFGQTNFRSMAPGVRRSFDLTCPTGSGTARVELFDTYI